MVDRRTPTILGGATRAAPRWLGPLPVWARPGPAGLRLSTVAGAARPAILRFDHDDFMQEYLDTLQRHPERLAEWLARPETWRDPMPAPGRAADEGVDEADTAGRIGFVYEATRREAGLRRHAAQRLPGAIDVQALKGRLRRPSPSVDAESLPLKLYQSSHKRHYLLCASLVSDAPGLPDCVPDGRRGELASFVIRRLLPPEDEAQAGDLPPAEWQEYAFVPADAGPRWQCLGRHGSPAAQRLAPGEERLPMFATPFAGDCREGRRLFCANVPVNRREQWLAAGLAEDAGTASAAVPGRSHAALLLQADVISPWRALLEQAEHLHQALVRDRTETGTDGEDDRRRRLRTVRDQLQTGSWYVLLDLARLLRERLPRLWDALGDASAVEGLEDDRERAVAQALRGAMVSWPLASAIVVHPYLGYWPVPGGAGAVDTRYDYSHVKWRLSDALLAAEAAGEGLEAVESTFSRFDETGNPLSLDPAWPDFLFPLADPEHEPPLPAVPAVWTDGRSGLERRLAAVDALADMLEALLPAQEGEGLTDTLPAGDGREAWFVMRCVYHRPHCGPLTPPVISAPTEAFQMAAFFDPDAPARPVRIPMPMDISPAGLRKYQKNTGFVVSDMLCGKLKGMRGMGLGDLVRSVLPWPFHKDLPDLDKTVPCKDGAGLGIGLIVSLSIPIVTLCALILMMIMVALFDVVFRWMPYLLTVIPVPGLKGKKKVA